MPGNDHARHLKVLRARAVVPVHTAQPLQQQVDRREVTDQQVEVDVQRLLRDLGGHDDMPRWARPAAVWAEPLNEQPVPEPAVRDGEPGVRERRLPVRERGRDVLAA